MGMVSGCSQYCFFWWTPKLISIVWCLSTETAAVMLKGQAKAKAVSATNPVKAKPHMNVPSPHRRVGVNKNFEVHAGIERASVTEGPSCYSACGRWMGLAWKWNRQTVGLRETQMERINIHQNAVCGFLPRISNYFIQICRSQLYRSAKLWA